MPARTLSALLLAAMLLLPASATAKPPDLPKDTRVDCEPQHSAGVNGATDLVLPVPYTSPILNERNYHVATPRRFPDGRVLIQNLFMGLHPATALLRLSDIIHCDDDEPYPVLSVAGWEIDTRDLLPAVFRDEAVPVAAPPAEVEETRELPRTGLEALGLPPSQLLPPLPAAEEPQRKTEKPQIMLKVVIAEVEREVAQRIWGKTSSPSVLLTTERTVQALQTLRELGMAKLVAEPNLVTLDGQQASVLCGGECPVPQPGKSADGTPAIRFIPFGYQVKLCATLIDGNHIRLHIDSTVSVRAGESNAEFSANGPFVAAFNSQNVIALVDMSEGQTVSVCAPSSVASADSVLVFFVTPAPGLPVLAQPPAPAALPGLASGESELKGAPPPKQVGLKVSIAEVEQSVARRLGGRSANPTAGPGKERNQPMWLDSGETIRAVKALRYVNLAWSLAEQALVTSNGRPASLMAGGEFPVPVPPNADHPTASAIHFIPFGVQLELTPTVTDKDRIRLTLNATVSTRDVATGDCIAGATVPGLNSHAISTTVEMREGQTLAIGGFAGRDGAELMILVTPQMLSPAEHFPAKVQGESEPSVCPYCRQKAAPKCAPPCPAAVPTQDVLENLSKLEEAEQFYQLAERCRKNGHSEFARLCYESASRLCPGSRFEQMSKEKLDLIADRSPDAVPVNSYSRDPNLRIEELLNESEDLRQAAVEWRKFWMNDMPSHLTPERVHGGISADNDAPASGEESERAGCGALIGCGKGALIGAACTRGATAACNAAASSGTQVTVATERTPSLPCGALASGAATIATCPTPVPTAPRQAKSAREREIGYRLSLPVSIKCTDTPLRKVVEDIRAWNNINVFLDEAALREEGISPDCPVSLTVDTVSLKSALNLLLSQAHLSFMIRDESLVITTEKGARGKLVQKVYSVADLVVAPGESGVWILSRDPGKDSGGEQLVGIIRRTVCPASWDEMGGPGSVDYFPNGMGLVVNQTADVQEQICDLLASLRRQQDQKQQQFDELIARCQVALRDSRAAEAEACVEQALAISPGNPLAELCKKAVVADLRRVRKLVSDSHEELKQKQFTELLAACDCCFKEARFEDAAQSAEAALRMQPDSAVAQAALALARSRQHGATQESPSSRLKIVEESADAEEQESTTPGGWWSFLTGTFLIPNLYIDAPPTDLILRTLAEPALRGADNQGPADDRLICGYLDILGYGLYLELNESLTDLRVRCEIPWSGLLSLVP